MAVGAVIAAAAAAALAKKAVEEGGEAWDKRQAEKKTEEMLEPGYKPAEAGTMADLREGEIRQLGQAKQKGQLGMSDAEMNRYKTMMRGKDQSAEVLRMTAGAGGPQGLMSGAGTEMTGDMIQKSEEAKFGAYGDLAKADMDIANEKLKEYYRLAMQPTHQEQLDIIEAQGEAEGGGFFDQIISGAGSALGAIIGQGLMS